MMMQMMLVVIVMLMVIRPYSNCPPVLRWTTCETSRLGVIPTLNNWDTNSFVIKTSEHLPLTFILITPMTKSVQTLKSYAKQTFIDIGDKISPYP